MILFPAIDLKDGQCVRLKLGEMDQVTVFNDDPGAQAALFEAQGFAWVHVVDLNGAFEGEPVNAEAVSSILGNVSIPIQLGGGIRTMEIARYWIEAGVSRIILGTAAVRDPGFVREAAKAFPGQVAVGLDARDGMVAIEGWADATELTTLEVAQRFEDAGVAAIIFTDISRDGVLKGLNMEATIALAEAISIPVIASGGLSSMEDIDALMQPSAAKLEGAISGRALYDGRIDPAQALARLRGETRA